MATFQSSEFLAALNREQKRLVLLAWPYVLGFIILASVPPIYLNLYYYELDSLYLLAGFLIWAMGYLLTLLLLQRGGFLPAGERGGIGTYFVLGLATGVLIALALVVLILPGFYLAMRWLPVYARALTTQDWAGNSMRWSWDATEPFQAPLSTALIGPAICYALAYSTGILPDDWLAVMPFEFWAIAVNVTTAIGSAWFTVLGIAAFATISAFKKE